MDTMGTVRSASLTAWLNTIKEKAKGRSNRAMAALIMAWLIMTVLVACGPSPSQPTQAPPPVTALPATVPPTALPATVPSTALPATVPPATALPTAVPPTAMLPTEMPALDGAALLDTRCSVCHSTDRVKRARKTAEQWEQTVTRMIGKGAQLTEAEKKVLVDYLANTYSP